MENVKKSKKMESVSAEDLKKIVKRMIKKTLNDNEHMVKLHRKVCGEWYSFLDSRTPKNPAETTNFPPEIPNKSPELTKNPIPWKKSEKKVQREEERQKVPKPTREEDDARQKIKEEAVEWRRQRAWEYYNEQKKQQRGWKRRKNFELNSWLNQLDVVLHQKYLREHRHRVKSFYCQPIYYGTELPEALFRQQCMQYGFTYQ